MRILITLLHFYNGAAASTESRSRARRRTTLAIALAALGIGLPVLAQDTDQGRSGDERLEAPAIGRPRLDEPNRPHPEEPPPLNLGGSGNTSSPGAPKSEPPKSTGHRWEAYASAVQNALETAVRANNRTRNKAFDVQCEMWIDPKGHVTRVQIVKPSGDADLDAALRNEVLPKLALPEPASDMPMPVKGHIAAHLQQ